MLHHCLAAQGLWQCQSRRPAQGTAEVVRRYLDAHCRRCLDEPVPALDGKIRGRADGARKDANRLSNGRSTRELRRACGAGANP